MPYPPVPYPPVEQAAGYLQEEREASPPVGGVAAAARVAPRVSTTFKPLTPTSTATRTTTTSLAVEITNLERKVQMLRQARKYQIADELGGDLGQSELEALGEKWREAGIAAASALWEHASSSPADLSISNSSSAPSNWSSTWGFAETSTSSPFGNQASPFESSWGWDSTPRGMGREEFTERLDEEVKLSGRTRREVLDDLDSDNELPTVDQLLESAGSARRTGSSKVKRRKVELDEQSEPASDDEVIEALDALDEQDTAAIEELEVDAPMDDDADDEDTEPPSQAKWTIGTLLRSVGVDPGVLGWNDDAEEFLSLSG
ncbi:hypothetical protein RQP46_008404 [Phenoliferia psychrophenolica]